MDINLLKVRGTATIENSTATPLVIKTNTFSLLGK
jgi:hypothetical protein